MKIKLITISFIYIFLGTKNNAQNVGVGTTSPQYKLDVAGRLRLNNGSGSAKLVLDGSTTPSKAIIGQMDNDNFGIQGTTGAGWGFIMNDITGNTGVGTTAPEYKLDIKGRMRIKQDTSTAGIWFDGSSNTPRAFLGTIDDNHVGIFGNGGAGWNFAMNVNNGNVGIGTSTPTSKLDLNGNLRIRSNAPIKGSVLMSADADGNAIWDNPDAFKAAGTVDNVSFPINEATWTKVLFNQNPHYNVGSGYSPSTAEYIVAEKGLYQFKACLLFLEKADKHSIRIRLLRNNVASTIGEIYHQGYWYHQQFQSSTTGYGNFDEPADISVQAILLPGDKVWVEAYINIYSGGGNSTNISEDATKTWFTGRQLARVN